MITRRVDDEPSSTGAGRRIRLTGSTLALTYVSVLFTVTLAMMFTYQQQLAGAQQQARQLRAAIRLQCQQRQPYDESSQRTRFASKLLFTTLQESEKTNRFIDDRLRAVRVQAYQRAIDALGDTLAQKIPTGCDRYR